MNSTVAQGNLLLTPTWTGHHPSAETTDWTGTWVCVGLAEQLADVGAVLPATIGYHATHVRRTEDGLVAAINARPFGVACRSRCTAEAPRMSGAHSWPVRSARTAACSTAGPIRAVRPGLI